MSLDIKVLSMEILESKMKMNDKRIKEFRDGLTLKELKKLAPWIIDANIENAVIGWDYSKNLLVWYGGTFLGGRWVDGIFKYGWMRDCIWKNGTFEDGIWDEKATWIKGTWIKGTDWRGKEHTDSPDNWKK